MGTRQPTQAKLVIRLPVNITRLTGGTVGVGLYSVDTGQMVIDMNKLILILILALIPGLSFAGSQEIRNVITMAKVQGGTPTYIINEGMEGTGAPSGWSAQTTYKDYDYATSPAPLAGAQSLLLDGVGAGGVLQIVEFPYTYTASTNTTWFSFIIHTVTQTTNTSATLFTIRDSANTSIATVGVTNTGILRVQAQGGTLNVSGSAVFSAGSAVHLRFKVEIGTSSDTAITAWSSTDGATWGSAIVSSTNGTTYNQPDDARIQSSTTSTIIVDNIRISEDEL